MLATAAASSNIAEYTVAELAFALKRTIEESYGLVRVRGELSGFKRAASGHLYFTLKDPTACLDYAEFLPREKAFWGMYSQLPKPAAVPFLVAVRPARGFCRAEAMAPLFAILSTPDWHA